MSIFDYTIGGSLKPEASAVYFSREMYIRKRLYNATFELTPVCNFSCKMCYVRLSPEEARAQGGILSGAQWIDLARQVNDLGAFHLALTGGECTAHPDFREIYAACYDMGLNVIVMTNASLIDEDLIAFFVRRPPAVLDISLYGFSRETYARACGSASAFDRVMHALDLIRQAGLPMQLKCTITKDMVQDFPLIYRYAKERGIHFSYNNTLKANRECDFSTAVANEVDYDSLLPFQIDADRLIGRVFEEMPEIDIPANKTVKEKGLSCSACNSSFHVNWHGEMTPCVTFDPVRFDLKEMSVAEAWEKLKAWGAELPEITECQTCRYYLRCKHCVALHWGDTGEYGKVSPRLCYKLQHGLS